VGRLLWFLSLFKQIFFKEKLPALVSTEGIQHKNKLEVHNTAFYTQVPGSGTLAQGCGSGSVWILINLSCWIRIRIQEGKNNHKYRKKLRIFMF
jgi:hypothetical protein